MASTPAAEALLLPGMDGTGRLFAPLVARLDPLLRCRVIAFPHERFVSYEQLAGDLDLPPTPFTLVAESFSGPLAVLLAYRYPERVRALVLAASFVRSPVGVPSFVAAMAGHAFRLGMPGVAIRWGLIGWDAAESEVNAVRAAISSVQPTVLAQRLRAIADVDVAGEFAACRAPVLYIAGRGDRLVSAKNVAEMKGLRPDMEVTTLDAPHLVLQRRPGEAAASIAEFMRRRR
jgi:pimeloyl-ACP methyl ester carboxylesterase